MINSKLNRFLSIFTVAAILLMSGINTFSADSSWQSIQEKKQLVIGFCAQYPPFEFKTETGEFQGFDVDLAQALGKELGISIVFKDGEWQGLIAGMKNGAYDMLITCMGKTTARKENVNFSDVYFDLTEVIVVRKDEKNIQKKADLKGKTVGAQMATSSERVLDGMMGIVGDAKKYNYTTEAFLDLKFKRIDALISGVAYATVQIKKDPSFKVLDESLNSTEIVMALPKGADTLTEKINHALDSVRESGQYQALYDKWFKIN